VQRLAALQSPAAKPEPRRLVGWLETNRLKVTGLVPKCTFLIGMLLGAFAALETSLSLLAQEGSSHGQLRTRADALATTLADIGARGAPSGAEDLDALRRLVGDLARQGDVLRIAILDWDGSLIAGAGPRGEEIQGLADDALSREARLGRVRAVRLDQEGVHVAMPVLFAEGQVGAARVSLSRAEIDAHLDSTRDRNTLLALAFLGVGFLLTFLLMRRITRPLAQLIESTEAVSLGRLDGRISVRSHDELKLLANSFNRMLDRLESTTVSRDYLTEILQSMSESLAVVTPDGRISLANRAMCRLLGYSESELFGMLLERLLAGEPTSPDEPTDLVARLQQEGQLDQVETCYLDRAGRPIDVLMSGALMWGPDGALRAMICIAQDNRERKRQEEQIRRLAFFDVVTGLPNRAHFRQTLDRALAEARRHSCKLAVLFLDLDRFKRINDTLGHATGDRLLEGFAMRLAQCVRPGDTVARLDEVESRSTVARLGGDEFTIILHRVSSSQDAASVARRILKSLDEPFELAGQEVVIDASIGISIYPDDSLEPDALLMHADTAMYHAKSQGRGNFQFFHPELNARAMDRLSLEADLRKALATEQLTLHFQPQVSLTTGEVVGVEALLRWYHPQRGLMPTDEVVALAEETGLIIPVGSWVLRSGCATARAWIDQGMGEVPVAINVSSRQLRQDGFVEEVTSALADHGLPARLLELEITESTAMAEPEATVEILRHLKDMGIEVAIDDFGTGYSSLSYLKRFPIGCVKIDRSFVRDVVHSPEDAGIIDAIVAMARQLRFRVVAEGVETEEQADFLRRHGCEQIQGYLVSRPQSAEQLAEWLRARLRRREEAR